MNMAQLWLIYLLEIKWFSAKWVIPQNMVILHILPN